MSIIVNLITFIKKLHISMITSKIYKSIIIAIIVIVICSILFYYAEATQNEKIKGFIDSLWWGLVTSTTVGYGDIYPVTYYGRLIAIILMIIAIGIFGFITASFASIFVEENLKKGMGLLDVTFRNHIVIVGWNFRSKSIIEELLNENNQIQIVLIDTIDQNPYNNKSISYIKGDASSEVVLNRANVKNASTVIVLADKKIENVDMVDAKSILICLAVNRINPDVYLISEVLNHKNIDHFKTAGVNDIIISSFIESKILVRSVLYKGIHSLIEELFTNSYGNEIYQDPIKQSYIGKKYEDVLLDLFYKNVTLIGIYRNSKSYINLNKDVILEKGDELIYIAKEKLNI